VLGLPPVPLNWPLGDGPRFRGVFNRETNEVNLFERTPHGSFKAPLSVGGIDDELVKNALDSEIYERVKQEVELLDGVTEELDLAKTLAGKQMPVFFGSAMNNFGVQLMLERFLQLAPGPAPRLSENGQIDPHRDGFSGFVFKIQANMNRQHRDSMAFVRVVSGRFKKGMTVNHARLQRRVRLPRAHRVFAQERETAEDAFPGDVVGLVNPGIFAIGDTICEGPAFNFAPLPRFSPEHFARLWPVSPDKHKAFGKGVLQLEEEGAIQVLFTEASVRKEPILAAVGELQFDLVQARLAAEYSVETRIERLPFRSALAAHPRAGGPKADWRVHGVLRTRDRDGNDIALLEGEWAEGFFRRTNPDVTLSRLA
jgi:peptide chain release factor 3